MIKKIIKFFMLIIFILILLAAGFVYNFIKNNDIHIDKDKAISKVKEYSNKVKNSNIVSENKTKPTIEKINIVNQGDNNYTFTYSGETFKVKYSKNNWRIYNSYKITNSEDMKVICQGLIDIHSIPGKDYKSNRTAEDMTHEWIQHNIAYNVLPEDNKFKDNAKNVDFNPEDQGYTFKDFYESRTGKKFDIKNIDYEKYIKYVKDNLYENN
jgi:hypothetical protein